MKPITWRSAVVGGAVVGLVIGGFTLADDGALDPTNPPGPAIRLVDAPVGTRTTADSTVVATTIIATTVRPATTATAGLKASRPAPATTVSGAQPLVAPPATVSSAVIARTGAADPPAPPAADSASAGSFASASDG